MRKYIFDVTDAFSTKITTTYTYIDASYAWPHHQLTRPYSQAAKADFKAEPLLGWYSFISLYSAALDIT